MSTAPSTLEKALHPATAGVTALIGAAAGGALFVSISGAVLGLITALGALGVAAIVLAVIGRLSGGATDRQREPAAATAKSPAASPKAAVASANGGEDGAAIIEPTESEAEILSAGRFADYHLAKAKRLLAAGNFKEAAYQAGASLSHATQPEAKEVLDAARAAMKS